MPLKQSLSASPPTAGGAQTVLVEPSLTALKLLRKVLSIHSGFVNPTHGRDGVVVVSWYARHCAPATCMCNLFLWLFAHIVAHHEKSCAAVATAALTNLLLKSNV